MAKRIIFVMVIVMMFSINNSLAGMSLIGNGSFEDDGALSDITVASPNEWFTDSNFPSSNFGGKVDDVWSTHGYDDSGFNSLTLYSKYNVKCNEGETALLSQEVYLEDGAEKLILDLKLSSSSGVALSTWHPSKRIAVVKIDGYDVWTSTGSTPDSNDELRNLEISLIDVNGFGDANPHILSLGLRSTVTESFKPYVEYRARWDFVKFDIYCGGFGYLPEDLNRDCYVNFSDYSVLAAKWLETSLLGKCDLIKNGVVDRVDVREFAGGWLDNSDWKNWADDNCYESVPLTKNLNGDEIVNFIDYALLVQGWNSGEIDYNDIRQMNEEWLEKSWIYWLE